MVRIMLIYGENRKNQDMDKPLTCKSSSNPEFHQKFSSTSVSCKTADDYKIINIIVWSVD